MPTDNVINFLLKMPKQKFTEYTRLQDTLFGQSLTYDVYQKKPFYKLFITVNIIGLLSAGMVASTAKHLYFIVSSITHFQFKENGKYALTELPEQI